MRYLFLLLFTACAAKPIYWTYEYNEDEMAKSCRLVHLAEGNYQDLELEFMRIDNEAYAYLKILNGTIESEEETVKVKLRFLNQTINGSAKLHSGGQKITLSKAIRESLLFALRNGVDIELSVEGYDAIFSGIGFDPLYKKFELNSSSNLEIFFPNVSY